MNLKRLFDIRQWQKSRRRTLHEIDEEFDFHLRHRAHDSEAEGMESADARHDAERRFGDVRRYRAQGEKVLRGHVRKQTRASFAEGVAQDLHFAVRALRRRPGFTAAAVLTLALGIGANAAMFGVIKTVVLAPLPFRTPDRVVQVWDQRPTEGVDAGVGMSRASYRDYQNLNEVFSHFAAVRARKLWVESGDRREFLQGLHVSSDLFEMMGVVPTAGRTFRPEEDPLDGAANIVLLTHAYWQREFGGEEVIGQTISLTLWVQLAERGPGNGWQTRQFEIVGVLPPDFRVPPLRRYAAYGVWVEPEVVLPLGLWTWGRLKRDMYSLHPFAQLREGVTAEQARADLQGIAEGIAESEPETQTGLEVKVIPIGELLRQQYGVGLGFLWAATALVLLVACASVSSLLLGWGVAREQELAVRAALGAGARRIFSQLLTEGFVLATTGGVLGVLLAYWGISALKTLTPAGVHRLEEASLDAGVLGFTLGVSLVTVLLTGLWPALRGARRQSCKVLKTGDRGSTLARTRSLRALVTAEVALSLVLLAGAGLMLQSFWNLVGVDTGMESDQVVQVTIQQPPRPLGKYPGRAGSIQLFNLMRDRVEAIPGVTSFALTQGVPLSGEDSFLESITIPGRPRSPADEKFAWWFVSQGYFRTMGIRLLEGRTWERDYYATNPGIDGSVVINEAMAKAVWPGESALGKFFFPSWVDPDGASELLDAWRRATEEQKPDGWPPWQVIGVVADTRSTLEREPRPIWYTPSTGGKVLLVRTSLDLASLGQVLRQEIEAVDPSEIEVLEIRTTEQIVAELGADSRFRAQLVILFAVLATGITCLGLFGVLTYAVAQRTRELGVRIALGARNAQIARLILSQGARMVGLGVALGLGMLLVLTRYIASLLFGVAPLDPMTLVGVAALIFGLALAAAYLPARRAMRVDPVVAMRHG